MYKDHIVDEIHNIREQIAHECNYDMKQIFERLKKKEKEHSDRLVVKESSGNDMTLSLHEGLPPDTVEHHHVTSSEI